MNPDPSPTRRRLAASIPRISATSPALSAAAGQRRLPCLQRFRLPLIERLNLAERLFHRHALGQAAVHVRTQVARIARRSLHGEDVFAFRRTRGLHGAQDVVDPVPVRPAWPGPAGWRPRARWPHPVPCPGWHRLHPRPGGSGRTAHGPDVPAGGDRAPAADGGDERGRRRIRGCRPRTMSRAVSITPSTTLRGRDRVP